MTMMTLSSLQTPDTVRAEIFLNIDYERLQSDSKLFTIICLLAKSLADEYSHSYAQKDPSLRFTSEEEENESVKGKEKEVDQGKGDPSRPHDVVIPRLKRREQSAYQCTEDILHYYDNPLATHSIS